MRGWKNGSSEMNKKRKKKGKIIKKDEIIIINLKEEVGSVITCLKKKNEVSFYSKLVSYLRPKWSLTFLIWLK